MKNEKVLRIELLKGAQYRRVEVTDGIATISQLAISSRYIASYGDTYELTGERRFCGFYDFVGNTLKIVKDVDSPLGYSTIGGRSALSNLLYEEKPHHVIPSCVGLLELIR